MKVNYMKEYENYMKKYMGLEDSQIKNFRKHFQSFWNKTIPVSYNNLIFLKMSEMCRFQTWNFISEIVSPLG